MPEVLRPLLAAGANPTDQNPNGETALTIATQAGNEEVVQILLAAIHPEN